MHQLAKEFSLSQEITVYDANQLYGEIGKYRLLQFSDDAVQGAIDLKNPERIVLEYPRAMIHLMENNDPSFKKLFIIGHGIGTIASHYSDRKVMVAEIDEKVVELSREYFNYRNDNVVIGDGRQILSKVEAASLDYIIVDAFTKEGTPYHLTTMEFFKMAREKLDSKGSVIVNLMGKIKNDKFINAIYTTLNEAYAYSKAFSLPGKIVSDIRNIIVIGSNKTIDFQPRAIAGFVEIDLEQGHIIRDR
ncbi:spermidine synthase [Paenibacillus sp. Soil522]|uniref:spermidine synthase n=1 Tax=Paenibacillus sp. Soil522 TaxID=1736388 RepID=UPI0006F6092E|nr:fused MFS/spermidine synthase [Paenibacillus sp. Soil522]KRE49047.1 spermidine synthase [Paenibacillus sp. Soil522]